MSHVNGRKRKNYYSSSQGNKKFSDGHILQPGIKGFLVTCNNKEQECLRETYNIVNELLEQLPKSENTLKDEEESEDETVSEDIETTIAREVKELKDSNKQVRPLKQVNTKCKNIIFVQLHLKDVNPVTLMSKLMGSITQTGKQNARFIQRITPVETTCKATIESIEKCVQQLFDESKNSDASNLENLITIKEAEYQISCKVRNNSDITRTEIIEAIAKIVKTNRSGWKVNFDSPQITLCIDVLIKTACVSFLPFFNEYKRYNLIEYSGKIRQEMKEKSLSPVKVENGSPVKVQEGVKTENEIKAESEEVKSDDTSGTQSGLINPVSSEEELLPKKEEIEDTEI